MTDTIRQVAEEMPDHQTSRGNEFRELSVEDRRPMARQLVIARAQVDNVDTGELWSDQDFRYHMRHKKETYMYYAGVLGIDIDEADQIWWSIVYDNAAPVEKRQRGLV